MTEHHDQPRPEEEEPAPGEVERPGQGSGEGATDDDATYPTSNPDAGPEVSPRSGGYAGRDPKTDMPRLPSVPETQDE